jgi:hypothetical protein
MTRRQTTLYTKAQVLAIMKAWDVAEPLPRKGMVLLVCFPGSAGNVAEVEKTTLKNPEGRQLWRITQSSSAGRDFDDTVQEAHVLAYRADCVERRRMANLARRQQEEERLAARG